MTTGEGGMITTKMMLSLAAGVPRDRHQGERKWGLIGRLGYNYRMTAHYRLPLV